MESKAICYKCFDDKYLSKMVEESGESLLCSVCGDEEVAFSLEHLGEVIEPVMRSNYGLVTDGFPYGESFDSVLEEVLGQSFEFQDDIIDAVIDAAPESWDKDSYEPYWCSSNNYLSTTPKGHIHAAHWHHVSEQLHGSRRFFSEAANQLFHDLFHDLADLKTISGELAHALQTLPAGTPIFRARVVSSDSLASIYHDPLRQIGPPPQALSRAGRMNAEGVTVLYSALDKRTCLAEMRPALGNWLAIIELQTTQPLRILDFSRLNVVRHEQILSYFQPDLEKQLDKRVFLRRINRMISQPVVPGKESDYLITQCMAEYLAHVHPERFDGIVFSSAQNADGKNLVIFRNPELLVGEIEEEFRVSYVPNTFEVFETKAINYDHSQISIGQVGRDVFGYDPMAFEDDDQPE